METSNERDQQERRTGPTVSKEKWVNHAKAKLSRGYVLIVGKNRRTANFYLKNKGYEMCGYDVAKQLVKDGVVVASGEHALGTVYALAANVTHTASSRPSARDAEEGADEMDSLLNQIATDKSGDAPAATTAI